MNNCKVKEPHLQKRRNPSLTHTQIDTTIEKEQTHKHKPQRETFHPPLIYNSSLSRDSALSHNTDGREKDMVPRLKWSHRQDQGAAQGQEQSWILTTQLLSPGPYFSF